MVDNKVKRIRPKDYELSSVQDNLANALDGVLDEMNGTQAATASRCTVPMGAYWVSSGTMATSDTQLLRAVLTPDGKSSGNAPYAETMPVAGTVKSVQGYTNGTPKGTVTFTVYINGKASAVTAKTVNLTAVSSPTLSAAYKAGDVLSVCVRSTSSSEVYTFAASLDVES